MGDEAFDFCEACEGESTAESADNFKQGMFGGEFRGHARFCESCGSSMQTLWSLFLYFPVMPLGTYRFKQGRAGFGGGFTFWSRKLPELDAAQVRSTRIAGTLLAMLVLMGGVGLAIYFRS